MENVQSHAQPSRRVLMRVLKKETSWSLESGCAAGPLDLFHAGHLNFLCDFLVAGAVADGMLIEAMGPCAGSPKWSVK